MAHVVTRYVITSCRSCIQLYKSPSSRFLCEADLLREVIYFKKKQQHKTQTWMWQFKKIHITAQNHTSVSHRRVSSLWLNCLNLFCKTPICSNETENTKQENLGLKLILKQDTINRLRPINKWVVCSVFHPHGLEALQQICIFTCLCKTLVTLQVTCGIYRKYVFLFNLFCQSFQYTCLIYY